MTDQEIISLLFRRDEAAIGQLEKQYGAYCNTVIAGILRDPMDREEVLSSVWLNVWNSIPPNDPNHLRLYLARIARNLAINTVRSQNTTNRSAVQWESAVAEISQCIDSSQAPEEFVHGKELEQAINRFLFTLPQRDRKVFVRRYFYLEDIAEIARFYGMSSGHTRMLLSRTRKKLKHYLLREGYNI